MATARADPALIASSLQRTGFALQRLPVKTAAAVDIGPSFTTTATSGSPLDFSPAATPEARKPWAAVTPVAELMARLRPW